MKYFSQLNEDNKTISIQDNTVNYLSAGELKKYLEIADKFISKEAKAVCNWLIDNNDTYIKKFQSSEKSENALLDFFNKGFPKTETDSIKNLYRNILAVSKNNRLMEIPVFMTRNQFDSILDKSASPDEVILDLDSEKGRNEIAKRFTPLVHKIANSWLGKTSFDYDDLFSYGMYGLTYAMNTYGKKSNKALKREEAKRAAAAKAAEETGVDFDPTQDFSDIDIEKYKSYTFLQYAAQMIRVHILEATKNDSHLVRIPVSRQKKEKDEKGYVAKSNSVSGDKKMGGKDGDEGKSLFDIVGGMENPGKGIDQKEIDDLWKEITNKLEEKFGEKTMDIFYNHFGWGGRQKLSGKEMAKKYGFKSPSSITAEIMKVIHFIKKDKLMYSKFVDIFELMKEAKHDEDEYDNDNEPIYVNSKIMEDRMMGLNNIDGNE